MMGKTSGDGTGQRTDKANTDQHEGGRCEFTDRCVGTIYDKQTCVAS